MSTRDSRYFQTLVFISYIFKRILAFALLVGFIGFFTIENYYGPKTFVEATAVARQRTNTIPRTFDYNEMGLTNSGNYCEMTNCKIIKCSSIPAARDPGNVTSNFVKSVFKARCPTTISIILIYKNCMFPSNTVRRDWLNMEVYIEQLTFEGCSLNRIDDEAFSEKIFTQVERLSIFNNKISSLNRLIFSKFIKLNQLLVQNNIIDYAESNLLANAGNTLEVLQLDAAIQDPEVLRNITGEKTLWKLESLSIQDNSLTALNSDLFMGIPKIRSLYLENSKIMEIRSNTFGTMADSLEQVFLRGNQISTLPEGIFNFGLSSKRVFRVYLTDNIWHCDCELKWIQEFAKTYPSVINEIPRCVTPESNAQLSFVEAKFCDENRTDVTTTPQIKSTSKKPDDSLIDNSTVSVSCSEIVSNSFQNLKVAGETFLSVHYEFRTRSPNFTLTESNDGTVMVSLPDVEGDTVLLWFDNQMQQDIQGFIRCVKNVKGYFFLKNTSPCTTYTVCFSENQKYGFSPLNCLGITTKPDLNDRPWLTNGYKTMVYLTLITLMLLFCAISAFGMFIVVRRNPSLLRGSKRVVMIKHRKIEAMILPKGVELERDEIIKETHLEGQPVNERPVDRKFCTEDGYVTPLPPNKRFVRKDSRTSRISFQSYGTGYVSGIEPAFWRFNRQKSESVTDELGPPPLPPHPQRAVPSVSMAIDSVNAENDENYLNDIL